MPGKNVKPESDSPQTQAELFETFSDEQLFELIQKEADKDSSVLAKLIMIQRVRNSLAKERFRQRVMTGVAIFMSCLALLVGIGGYFALQEFQHQRSERTVTACNKDRRDAINDNKNLEEQAKDLYFFESLAVNPDSPKAPFLYAVIDKRVADKRKNYQTVRICTDKAIEDYNNSGGKLGIEDGPMVEQAKRLDHVDIPTS